jgi:ribosomal protein S3AE
MAQTKKKRKFFDVEIPLISKTTHLYAFNAEELEGKQIIYDLTRILRGKGALLKAKVILDQEKLTTKATELKILPYFLKRMVRKGTNYVEDSFTTNCADGELLIKPFLVTRRKVSRAVRKALREKAKEELTEYLKNKDSETIFDEILQNRLQKTISLKLKKVYPLSTCEIRIITLKKELDSKEEKPKETKKKVVKEEKVEEKKETTTKKE